MLNQCSRAVLLLLLIPLITLTACASGPEQPDPNYLGDYPEQDLGSYMLNTIPQGKDEVIPRETKFTFYPKTNIVQVNFRYSVNNIDLFLYQDDRAALVIGLSRYLDDYKAGKLITKNNKKKAYFGSTKADMMWGILGTGYYAKPTLRFEYQFIGENKPYFVMANQTSPRTNEEGRVIKDGGGSPAIRLAVSPIQAQKFIEILSQEYLQGLLDSLQAESEQFDLPLEENTKAPEMF